MQMLIPDPPSAGSIREAQALTLEERANVVEACGEPVVQNFGNPSFAQLQQEEREQRDLIAEYAALAIFGEATSDGLPNRMALDLEGGAMFLVRRIHPEWVKAAHEQAVETLLLSDEYRALMRDRGLAEARVIAHRLVANVRAALIGTLENSVSVTPAVFLKLAAARTRAGAR
jgi:hypothetical protein